MEQNTTTADPLTIGVLGGTGTAGAAIVHELGRRGHQVRVMSRSAPGPGRIDLTDADTHAGALAGLDVLIDAVNHAGTKEAAVRAVLVDGLGEVLAAADRAGVGHVVSLGIIGAEQVPMGYYRAKVAQEGVVRGGPVASTIVRATQFHQLVATWAAAAAKLRPMLLPKGELQPVDPREVAVVVADAAEARKPGGDRLIAGPAVEPVADLARRWAQATQGGRRRIVTLPAVGGMLRAVARGALTDPAAPRGTRTFDDWLAEGGA